MQARFFCSPRKVRQKLVDGFALVLVAHVSGGASALRGPKNLQSPVRKQSEREFGKEKREERRRRKKEEGKEKEEGRRKKEEEGRRKKEEERKRKREKDRKGKGKGKEKKESYLNFLEAWVIF